MGRWRQKIRELPRQPRLRAIPTVFDEKLLNYSMHQEVIPTDWAARALYLGEEGDRAWLEISGDPSYPLANDAAFRMGRMRGEALKKVDVKTEALVSLGPGDGELDRDIVEQLAIRLPKIRYIPVEISSGLLAMSVQKLKGDVNIPIAILGDFECGQRFIGQVLDQYASPPKPVVFSLVGGTFGNLTAPAPRSSMASRISCSRATPSCSTSPSPGRRGRRRRTPDGEGQIRRPLPPLPGRRRRAARPRPEPGVYQSWFDERIECACTPSPHIGDTQVITIRDRPTGRTLLRFNRYRWDSIRSWIEAASSSAMRRTPCHQGPADVFGMAVMLLGASTLLMPLRDGGTHGDRATRG